MSGVVQHNQGCIALVTNTLSYSKSNHIDVRFLFVRELLRAKKIDSQFLASAYHHADALTKCLAVTPFKYHRRFLLSLPFEGESSLSGVPCLSDTRNSLSGRQPALL